MKIEEFEKELGNEGIVNYTKYMDWLCEFTCKFPMFWENNWVYNGDVIDNKDIENVKKLDDIYNTIRRDYVVPVYNDSFREYFIIKYNNIGFRIGIYFENGICFCERVSIDDKSKYIDFYDYFINGNNKCDEKIRGKLDRLYDMVIDLFNKGVNSDDIVSVVNRALIKKKVK